MKRNKNHPKQGFYSQLHSLTIILLYLPKTLLAQIEFVNNLNFANDSVTRFIPLQPKS